MELQVHNAAKDVPALGEDPQVGFDEQLQELIRRGSLDFDTWTSIISKVEKTHPDDIEKICSVYDAFLSEFPLCHGYWRKYAAHKAHLCTADKVVEIFERAVQSATFCVGIWVEYCTFSMSAYEDPSDVRRLFKRALSSVGKDFLCHPLWDKYIEFEFSQQQWSFLAQIYVQILKFPTKKLHSYYDNFKKFVAILEEEMQRHNDCSIEMESESVPDAAVTTLKDEVSRVINSLLDPSTGSFRFKALQKYISIGESFYQEACELERKIHCFEANIRRPYFHIKPLDDNQLENWHRYLDFVEMQEDFDWAVKLYERCLIPCAAYPEFWMRYVEFMETKGGRELANFALDRATKIFLKNVPVIHLFNSRFKEQIGDKYGARAAFVSSDNEFGSEFVDKVVKEANMEKRLGNFAAASSVYEKALEMAAKRQKLHCVPILYIQFSRLKYMMTGSIDAARGIIIDGIQHVPHCKVLLEGLIHFLIMHGGQGQVNVVDNIIADAISPGSDASQSLGAKDREDISVLYLQFVDQCGTVHDIIKAWNRHIKLFPHLIRTTSSNKLPTSGNQLLNMVMEGRKKSLLPLSDKPSGGHNPDNLIQLQMPEQRLLLPENHAIHPDQVFTDQFQPEDKANSAQERLQHLSSKIAEQAAEDAFGVNKSAHCSVHQSGDDASQQMESTTYSICQSREAVYELVESTRGLVHKSSEDAHGPIKSPLGLVHQPGEDAYGPMEATHGLAHQPGEDSLLPIEPTTDLVHQVADDHAILDASQEYSDSINVQQEQEQEQDHQPEQHVNPLPLDGLPLNFQEKDYGDSTPMSCYEHQSPTSNGIPDNSQNANKNPSIVSPGSTRSTDSTQVQNESVNPLYVACHQNPLREQVKPQPRVPTDGAGNWHDGNNTLQASGVTRPGFHGDSQDQQNQQRQVSPRQHSPPAEMDASTPTNQGYSNHPLPGENPQVQQGIQAQNQDQVGAAQGNSTATHSWPTQNLQRQSFVSVHQSQPDLLPASHSQVQMPQFSMQSSGHFGSAAPYNQAYNQMMENYFRQQQQMIVQQHYDQQQQFMQQLQQQVQQPYQQQQQQQHLLQPYQQHELYAQQQRQLAQLYYQQLPQLQEQQAQLMRQQLQYAHQQQDQLYHQYMQLQEQQQHGYQQQNPTQQHPLQPITSTQIPAWTGSYYQQYKEEEEVEGTPRSKRSHRSQTISAVAWVMARDSASAVKSSLQNFGSSHSRVESSQQIVTSQDQQVIPPHSASASSIAESPHSWQKSQGTPPPHRAATSGSTEPPHHK